MKRKESYTKSQMLRSKVFWINVLPLTLFVALALIFITLPSFISWILSKIGESLLTFHDKVSFVLAKISQPLMDYARNLDDKIQREVNDE